MHVTRTSSPICPSSKIFLDVIFTCCGFCLSPGFVSEGFLFKQLPSRVERRCSMGRLTHSHAKLSSKLKWKKGIHMNPFFQIGQHLPTTGELCGRVSNVFFYFAEWSLSWKVSSWEYFLNLRVCRKSNISPPVGLGKAQWWRLCVDFPKSGLKTNHRANSNICVPCAFAHSHCNNGFHEG